MKLLRVDMAQLKTEFVPVPPVYERLGGRASDCQITARRSAANVRCVGSA